MENRLPLEKIFEIIQSSIGSRCLTEAEKILVANHLIMCGVRSKDENVIFIEAVCLRSTAVKEKPHTVNCSLIKNGNVWDVEKVECSCKAGKSQTCKHCVAVLLYCNRNNINQLEMLSSTDIKCTWSDLSSKFPGYSHPIPAVDFCHVKSIKNHYISEERKQKFKTAVLNLLPNSALAKQEARYSAGHSRKLPCFDSSVNKAPLTKVLEHIFKKILVPHVKYDLESFALKVEDKSFYLSNVVVTREESMNIALSTTDQKSERWTCERKRRITGSTCYELYTYSKNSNPQWDKKLNKILNPNFLGTTATAHGNFFEENARLEYGRHCKTDILQCGLIVHPELPMLGYSPDGLLYNDKLNRLTLIEIKCPILGSQKSATDVIEHLDYLLVDNSSKYGLKKKHKYYGQIQLGLFLTGAALCDLIIFSSFDNSFVKVIVEKDHVFIQQMILVLFDIYFNRMLPAITNYSPTM